MTKDKNPVQEDKAAEEELETAEQVAPAETAESVDPAPDVETLLVERDELKDRLLRALAEAENLRKRGERDRRDAELYGGTRLARDLLSFYDNLERALDTVSDDVREIAGPMIDGLEHTQRDILAAFLRNKIEPVKPEVGDRFDPKLHQAMFEAPIPNTKAGAIIQVMTTGFTIGERLLRPSQVGVSSGGPDIDLSADEDDVGEENAAGK